MKYSFTPFLSLLLTAASANAATSNYVITGYATSSAPIVDTGVGGTTDVPGGGEATNTVLVAAGPTTFVDFTIGDAGSIIGDQYDFGNINALPTVATFVSP